MDMDQTFTFQTAMGEICKDVIEAVAERPGDSEAKRYSRHQTTVYSMMSFMPRDPLETMLAGHCVIFDNLLRDGARDTLRGQPDLIKLRARPQLLASGKMFLADLDKFEHLRTRQHDKLSVQPPAREEAADPIPAPEPEAPRTEAAPVPAAPEPEQAQTSPPINAQERVVTGARAEHRQAAPLAANAAPSAIRTTAVHPSLNSIAATEQFRVHSASPRGNPTTGSPLSDHERALLQSRRNRTVHPEPGDVAAGTAPVGSIADHGGSSSAAPSSQVTRSVEVAAAERVEALV